MNVYLPVFTFVAGAFVGVILYLIFHKRKSNTESPMLLQCEDCDKDQLAKEWEVTINTQMHFNDLIIRFRSIVLSVFVASLGIIYGSAKQLGIQKHDIWFLLGLALVFWICCFIMDYFYYYRLLIGSVKHAEKFDHSDFFKQKGLYGLTQRINDEINPIRVKILILLFYLLPIVGLIAIVIVKEYNLFEL